MKLQLRALAATQLELQERCARCLGWQWPFLEDLRASTLLSAERQETLASGRLFFLGTNDGQGASWRRGVAPLLRSAGTIWKSEEGAEEYEGEVRASDR